MDKLTKLAMIRNPELAHLHMASVLGDLIEKGKGDKGETPVKYVDYFTPAEIQQIIDEITSIVEKRVRPVKGVDYFDGENGVTPIKGVHYKDGKPGDDGKTPKKGKDYFTKEDIALIAKKAAKLVETPPAPKVEDIHTEVDERVGKTYATIKDLNDLITFLKAGGFRGGGGSTGGGGVSTVYNDTVTGTIDGVNRVFTVPNTIQSPIFCSLANSNYQAGVDYTVTGPKQITFVTAPDSSLAGQPFWLGHT